MHVPWSEVELFLAVAEAGSLTAAAQTLRVTQPTISRRLAELEASLGEPLFERSVEGTSLTSFGERLLEPVRRMSEAGREVDHAASGAETKPRGVVRVTAPPGVAFDLVAPFAGLARSRLPEVQLEVVSSVAYLDLVRREADLAVRLQRLDRADEQRGLVLLASHEHEVAAFATREYAASLPRGCTLREVDWIAWPPSLAHLPPNPQLAARIPGFRPVFTSDDFLVQLRAAEAGVGAVLLGRFRSRLAPPTTLVEMAVDLGRVTTALHLVAGRSALAIPRVRAVADLLTEELKGVPRRSRKK
jgi:DNA-binding transcriptional LysR family regulator